MSSSARRLPVGTTRRNGNARRSGPSPLRRASFMKDRRRRFIPPQLELIFRESKAIKKWLWKMRMQVAGLVSIRKNLGTINPDLNVDDLARTLSMILDRVAMNLPEVICSQCWNKEKCKCNGKGWLTKCQEVKWLKPKRPRRRTSAPDTSQTASTEASSESPPSTESTSSTY